MWFFFSKPVSIVIMRHPFLFSFLKEKDMEPKDDEALNWMLILSGLGVSPSNRKSQLSVVWCVVVILFSIYNQKHLVVRIFYSIIVSLGADYRFDLITFLNP
jgi:hypothetical protein